MFAHNRTCENPCGEIVCCSASTICVADDDNLRCISEQSNIAALVLAYGLIGVPVIAILVYVLSQQNCFKSICKPLVTVFNLFSKQDHTRSEDVKLNHFITNVTDVENNDGSYQPPVSI